MSSPHHKFWRIALPAVVAVIAGLAAGRWWLDHSRAQPTATATAAPEIGGYVLATPRVLEPFDLVDADGKPFASTDFAGHWSFVFFGYTYCPDVCPLTLTAFASLKKQLATESPSTAVDYYLVSVDPDRDTPARLHDYVGYFDPSFHGLTGNGRQISTFAGQTGTIFFIPPNQSADSYLVSHTSNIVLLDPAGHVHAIFTTSQEPKQLAADFAKILAHYGPGNG